MSEQVTTPVTRAAQSIPDYELLRPIGRGAYGEVWLARNVTGSLVALKIVHRAAFDHDRPFEREFEGIKRFEPISRSDPSQLAIFHVGRGDGFFYYVMELADSVPSSEFRVSSSATNQLGTRNPELETYAPLTLKRLLNDRGALPASECLDIALSLTRALAHLHGHGLVHRDVKPSNVIFVNGMAKLADIGLVTSVDATRSFVGTEGYLPPEGAGTPQADLYSLGKVLYEMSTGCDRKEFPALPRDIATRPDRDALAELNAIVVRACQISPNERYASADAMRADLELLEAGKSVKRQRSWQRTWSHAKKIGLTIGVVAVALSTVYWLSVQQPRPSDTAQPRFWPSTNALANEDFLKGVHALQIKGDNASAIQYFKSAIQKDPNFAEAYARLSWAHYSYGEADPNPHEGPEAARMAVKLNPKLAYGHSMLATAKAGKLDWAGAEEARQEAIRLNPNSQEILLESALNLACMGRTNEALRDLEKARLANPESASNTRELFYRLVYGWCRQYDKALEIYGRTGTGSYFANQHRALAHLGAGDFTNFMRFAKQAALAKAENVDQVNAEFEVLTKAFEEGGPQKYWELSLTFETSKRDADHPMRMAAIHAQLDKPREAFLYLRRAMRESPNWFSTGLYTNPSFDSLRTNAQFTAMVEELWRWK